MLYTGSYLESGTVYSEDAVSGFCTVIRLATRGWSLKRPPAVERLGTSVLAAMNSALRGFFMQDHASTPSLQEPAQVLDFSLELFNLSPHSEDDLCTCKIDTQISNPANASKPAQVCLGEFLAD